MQSILKASSNTGDKAVLFIIDVQNDFCEPDGSLAVSGSQDIIPLINNLREHSRFDYIVLSRDWHQQNHCSFASNNGKELFSMQTIPETGRQQVMWPDHCVQGTFGAEFHSDLVVVPSDIQVLKGKLQWVETYSGFGSVDLGEDLGLVKKLQELGVRDVYCCGLATDYCVGSTAYDSAKYGFNTYIIADAARHVAEDSCKNMKDKCVAQGVKWITSSDFITLTSSDVIKKVRNTLGSPGVSKLGRTFSVFDADGNRKIDQQELLNGLNMNGVSLSQSEANELMTAFDYNRNGTLDFNEFYSGVVGPISQTKLDMIEGVFNKFDKTGTGSIKSIDLKIAFNSSNNPMVISGEMTKDEAYINFLANFADNLNDGKITKQQWYDYYAAVSLATPQDKQFVQILKVQWNI